MAGGNIRRPCIDELTVNLVREKKQVVLLDQITYLVHLTAGIKVARRIIGIADEDSPGTLIDQLLELLHLRKRKTFLYRGSDGAHFGTGRNSERHIVGISRFGNNNLITRIQARQEREQHSLGTAGCNDDIIRRQLDIELIIITYQLFAITAISRAGTILQNLTINVAYRVNRDLRRGQVGLSDVQVEYVHTPLLGCISQRSQLSDRRRGHFHPANRYCWHV